MIAVRSRAGSILREHNTCFGDFLTQVSVVRGIDNINATSKHGNGCTACFDCGSRCNTVDTLCHSANDKCARRGKFIRHFIRLTHSVCTHTTRSHNTHTKIAVEIGQASAIVQNHWWLLNLAQSTRIGILIVSQYTDSSALTLVENFGGALQTLVAESSLGALGQVGDLFEFSLLGAKDIKRRIVKRNKSTKSRRTCAKRV